MTEGIVQWQIAYQTCTNPKLDPSNAKKAK